MSILTKSLGHEKTYYILLIHLTKMTFLTKCQIENLVKMDKHPSKCSWFSQIDHPNLTLNQIGHYDLAFSQTSLTHLMTLPTC
jgi:hypothetical protein